MNPARIAIIVVALVAAVGLALFVHSMFGTKPAPVVAAAAPTPAMTRVLVAKADLGVGDRLTVDNIDWQSWPTTTLNAAYITDGETAATPQSATAVAISKASTTVGDLANGGGPKLKAMVGAIVREPIFAGEPITSKEIVRSGDTSYMAIRLPEGMRAISLPISIESGAGGFIQPGDHIDVMSTHTDTSAAGGGAMVTESVLSNVLVLAMDQRTDTPKTGPAVAGGATVTLEVPETSASAVAKARVQGGLTMALRSYSDIGGHTIGASADNHTVRLFKGGAPSQVTVQ